MVLYLLAFLGGALTIASPCILPVLPFVFANADKSFLRRGLPMLIGMAATFAAVATLAAFGGGWAARANEFGRWAALALLAVFGLTLLFPSLSERLTGPLVALGGRLSEKADREDGGIAAALLLGVATGFLWAPCAGPILGLILTGAALQGASATTTLLLLSLRPWRRDLAGAGAAGRREGFCGHETRARRGRMDSSRLWRGGGGGGRQSSRSARTPAF